MNDTESTRLLDGAEPAAVAGALIRCPSVTPHEAGALTLLETLLAPQGFTCHRLTFSAAGTADVDNLYARIGDKPPVLLFNGHIDVVPPGDPADWTHPPFAGTIVDDVLYGRGAVDMKGAVAAFVAAVARFLRSHGQPQGSIALAITADEEGPAINGTAKLLDWATERRERFDAAIVGEPTSRDVLGDMIKIGRRGSLSGRLTVIGRQGHTAYPHLALNPVHGLCRLVAALTARPLDEGSAEFLPSNLEVTTIDVGNPAFNVIPERAHASFNIRFNDGHSVDRLSGWLSDTAATVLGEELRWQFEFEPNAAEPFLTHDQDLIDLMTASVESVTGRRPELSTSGGTSDARFVKDHCPVVEFGLVSRTIHQIDERVPLADLNGLTAIYHDMLERFFMGRSG